MIVLIVVCESVFSHNLVEIQMRLDVDNTENGTASETARSLWRGEYRYTNYSTCINIE